MEYRKFGNTLLVRMDPGDEIVTCLAVLAREEDIQLAGVSGLGAADEVELGIFHTGEKHYYSKVYKGMYEIASLTGNISRKEGQPYLHLHGVIGNPRDGECHGGHMNRAVISATAELIVTIISGEAGRRMDEAIGLNLINFYTPRD